MGLVMLLTVTVVFGIAANAFRFHHMLAIGTSIMVVASLWIGWCACCNALLGCWKCAAVWLTMLPVLWLAYFAIQAGASPAWRWLILGYVLLLWLPRLILSLKARINRRRRVARSV